MNSDDLSFFTTVEIPPILKHSHQGLRVFTEDVCARFGCGPTDIHRRTKIWLERTNSVTAARCQSLCIDRKVAKLYA